MIKIGDLYAKSRRKDRERKAKIFGFCKKKIKQNIFMFMEPENRLFLSQIFMRRTILNAPTGGISGRGCGNLQR